MREIKIRIWDMIEGDWITGWDNFAPLWGLNLTKPNIYSLNRIPKELIIQQFTGCYDRDGREIYEGDFLKWETTAHHSQMIGRVSWLVNGYAFRNKLVNWNLSKKTHKAKIIGNIFENEELIKNE